MWVIPGERLQEPNKSESEHPRDLDKLKTIEKTEQAQDKDQTLSVGPADS